jgi:hypothetical protein
MLRGERDEHLEHLPPLATYVRVLNIYIFLLCLNGLRAMVSAFQFEDAQDAQLAALSTFDRA